MPIKYGPLDHEQVWTHYAQGQLPAEIGRSMGRPPDSIYALIYKAGGIKPAARVRSSRQLSMAEREEISRGLAAGESCRGIATRLGRAASTITREVNRNGGRACYRALSADRAAGKAAVRPKASKLARRPALRCLVEQRLRQRWSPEQIAGWLRREQPEAPEWWGSHETIYRSLFVQARGALKHELTGYLRTRRVMRRPRGANHYRGNGMGQLRDIISIRERPAEVEDRAVPGHWEGDLIHGTGGSAVGTLVERSSRLVMLVKVDKVDAETVAAALRTHILTLPEQLRRSLTWDQGKEMGRHVQFTIDTGVAVYFCDPKSPWQRGSNENTNGLVRQYLPKRTDLKPYSQADLDTIALELNERPRKTLEFMTPIQKFAEAVALTT
ncbi:MAG: IS30 family transposase [Actinomycetota bacterium]|nr:IS30 family transposase [Actinomycetota bacterium]